MRAKAADKKELVVTEPVHEEEHEDAEAAPAASTSTVASVASSSSSSSRLFAPPRSAQRPRGRHTRARALKATEEMEHDEPEV